MPASYIIQRSGRSPKYVGTVFFLGILETRITDKWGVSENVVDFISRDDIVPVDAESVRVDDALVVGKRQFLVDTLRHLCRVGVRLLLSDPERRAGNATSEVLQLNTMEVF